MKRLPFKKGDRVVCVMGKTYEGLDLGKEYTVLDDELYDMVRVNTDNIDYFLRTRFKYSKNYHVNEFIKQL